jgi:hypothetical protein
MREEDIATHCDEEQQANDVAYHSQSSTLSARRRSQVPFLFGVNFEGKGENVASGAAEIFHH